MTGTCSILAYLTLKASLLKSKGPLDGTLIRQSDPNADSELAWTGQGIHGFRRSGLRTSKLLRIVGFL